MSDTISSDVVSSGTPTEDGKGRVFKMEPGKRIVLEQWDQWQPNSVEDLQTQISRISRSPKEEERRRLGAQRLKERLCNIPYYALGESKHGNEYWASFYDSGVMS